MQFKSKILLVVFVLLGAAIVMWVENRLSSSPTETEGLTFFDEITCPSEAYDTTTPERMHRFLCANFSFVPLDIEQIKPELISELTYTFSEGGMFEVVVETPDQLLFSTDCPQMIVRMSWSNNPDEITLEAKRTLFDQAVEVSDSQYGNLHASFMVPIRSALHPDAASRAHEYLGQPPSQLCLTHFLSEASTGAYIDHTT